MPEKFVVPGNKVYFTAFTFANFILMLCAIAGVACASWLTWYTGHHNGFNVAFVVVTCILTVISIAAFFYRKKINLLLVYLIILFCLFIAETTLTIMLFTDTDKILSWAEEANHGTADNFYYNLDAV